MEDRSTAGADPGVDRIDPDSEASVGRWAAKFSVTEDQIRDAVRAVGSAAPDVEMHLKGSHATTNAEQAKRAGAGGA